jgi:hypothetical protein
MALCNLWPDAMRKGIYTDAAEHFAADLDVGGFAAAAVFDFVFFCAVSQDWEEIGCK